MKNFADTNPQYLDIHHTKEETEVTLSACCIVVLKTLPKPISQCSLVPYIKSDVCKVRNELDN